MKTSSPFRFARSTALALSPLIPSLLGVACQDAETHELGFTQSSRQLTGAAPAESPDAFFAGLEGFEGHWRGEAEAALPLALDSEDRPPTYHFPSGSTAFALDLALGESEYGEPALLGTLTFGAGTAPAPATDPELGYPVGLDYASLLSYGRRNTGIPGNLDQRLPPFEAFPYSVVARGTVLDPDDDEARFAKLGDGVLVLNFNTNEILDGWCQLQTPTLNKYGVYQILPAETGGLEIRGDGTNASCELYGESTNHCPPGVDPASEQGLSCLDEPPVIGHASCDKTFLARFCDCTPEGCRAFEVASTGTTTSSLLVRRIGDRLLGAFQNEIFLNARNLTVPMGQATFTRQPD